MPDLNETGACLLGPLNSFDPSKVTTWMGLLGLIAVFYIAYTVYAIYVTKDDAAKTAIYGKMTWGIALIVVAVVVLGISGMFFTSHTTLVPPVAFFSADPDYGEAPLSVMFTDHSRPVADNRSWTFGSEPVVTTGDASTGHTFQTAGEYTVTLVSSNAAGKSEPFHTRIIVTDPQSALVAGFHAGPALTDPFTINFDDTTVRGAPIIFRLWKFGDGESLSSFVPDWTHATHTYPAVQPYTVELTVIDRNGKMSTASNTIEITGVCNASPQYDNYKGIWTNANPGNTTGIVSLEIVPNTRREIWLHDVKQGCTPSSPSCTPNTLDSTLLCIYSAGWLRADYPDMSLFIGRENDNQLNVRQFMDDGTSGEYNLTRFI
jgi:PKD repeat protein